MTQGRTSLMGRSCVAAAIIAAVVLTERDRSAAQSAGPEMLDPSLTVRTAVSGLTTPIGMAFIGHDEMLVLARD